MHAVTNDTDRLVYGVTESQLTIYQCRYQY
ncbi:type II toxin-antitoxin system YoeB family toxin [Ferrimonas lipolytica]|uniref:Type II toxin-antitoxin system YoeB family toxin n=1 Tax=Ferrimonas lipolytica TaxID=2724191 RepID=A0A6H1UKX1_9GAMM|nr:type II toxin-antitoxin system YoeB family toxin [Ferrimonas lipolytica]